MAKKLNAAQLLALKSHANSMRRLTRAIDHNLRFQIMELLRQHGKMTVTDLFVQLRLEQSVASQHLSIMRTQGLVKTSRDGKFIHYSLAEDLSELLRNFETIDQMREAA